QYETDLLATVETFLEADGNVAGTAQRLFTHRHTVEFQGELHTLHRVARVVGDLADDGSERNQQNLDEFGGLAGGDRGRGIGSR
ncbi:MAG: PucR family transcriptional regulator, partial [Acidimicrobiia bacterium]|nr:PucR family transcriptional regulator [Acidimicrobiia bacterium]